MWDLFFFLFFHLQLIISLPLNSSSSPSANKLCSPEQSFALLHFKNSISVDHDLCDSYLKTNSWKEESDCCSWYGVTCDTYTGHVVGLDLSHSCLYGTINATSSLLLLHHLQELNLAFNGFECNFSSKFGQFKELTYLNLSHTLFLGRLVPTEIFYHSKLLSLDLSDTMNPYSFRVMTLSQDRFSSMVQNLTKLRHLNLNGVDMSSVAAASLVNLSSSLISLSLANTHLEDRFPNDIFHLPFLQQLSLSGNNLLIGNLPKSNWSGPLRLLDLSLTGFSGELPDTIGNLKYLEVLNLPFTSFSGELPDTIGNLKYLKVLDLSQRRMIFDDGYFTWIVGNFTGQVPTSISKLGELTSLNLEGNIFSGQIPDVFDNLTKLTHLQVAHNNFSGRLPSSAFNLPRLSTLDFSDNQFEGQIPCQVSGFSLPSLQILYLQSNKLCGPIPNAILDLVNLIELDLSSNNLSGILNSHMFSKLQNVQRIDFSSNNLSGISNSHMFSKLQNVQKIDFSHNKHLSLTSPSNANFSLPKLQEFSFSSCSLSEVPMFLRYAKNLQALDLSNNKISGKIYGYKLELCKNLHHLDLSHNFLTSFERILSTNLVHLDLRSNLLQGPLFDLPTAEMAFLSLSNNQFIGEIPSSFCNFRNIYYLSLSNNSLNGTIPQCLGKLSLLETLDLQMNNFHGNIPQSLAQSGLSILNLNGNQLLGPFPLFDNSSELEVLDVGNNKINDAFPHCLASLPNLQVLILRSNRFHGPIGNSTTIFHFQELRVLDLSHNQFNGHLPTRFFANFEALMQGSYDDVYVGYMQSGTTNVYYSMTLTVKGVDMVMDRILNIFTAMDLSSNLFQEGIPAAIGNLNSLKLLNLSHNKLTGHIPSSFENLTELEALDLSSNELTGDIPLQLAGLTSLELLNLSYNQLKGPIPKGKQFDTFQNDSYMGNLGLCGFPLSKKCGPEPPGPTIFHKEDDSLSWLDWKVTMIGCGCGLVIGLSIGYIVFATRRPQWFVRMVERKQSQMVRRLRGRIRGRRN